MKYLCSVGEIVEADSPVDAEAQFLSMHTTFKQEDLDCIEFDIPDLGNMDANEMVDLIEDCLAKHHG
jgi:hypothetical protein